MFVSYNVCCIDVYSIGTEYIYLVFFFYFCFDKNHKQTEEKHANECMVLNYCTSIGCDLIYIYSHWAFTVDNVCGFYSQTLSFISYPTMFLEKKGVGCSWIKIRWEFLTIVVASRNSVVLTCYNNETFGVKRYIFI